MAVQQNKVSRSKRDMRRGHDKLTNPVLAEDKNTGELHRRHHITKDGFYRGKQILKSAFDDSE